VTSSSLHSPRLSPDYCRRVDARGRPADGAAVFGRPRFFGRWSWSRPAAFDSACLVGAQPGRVKAHLVPMASAGPGNRPALGCGRASAIFLPPNTAYRCPLRRPPGRREGPLRPVGHSGREDRDDRGSGHLPGPAASRGGRAAGPCAGHFGRPPPSAPAPAPPTAAGLDPRFPTCTAAKAAGYGPYVRGVDPEYSRYQDRDGYGDCLSVGTPTPVLRPHPSLWGSAQCFLRWHVELRYFECRGHLRRALDVTVTVENVGRLLKGAVGGREERRAGSVR
jgi:hypothetical protein